MFIYMHVVCTQLPLGICCCKTGQGEPFLNAWCVLSVYARPPVRDCHTDASQPVVSAVGALGVCFTLSGDHRRFEEPLLKVCICAQQQWLWPSRNILVQRRLLAVDW